MDRLSEEGLLRVVVFNETRAAGCKCRSEMVTVQDPEDDHWEVVVIHQFTCPMEIRMIGSAFDQPEVLESIERTYEYERLIAYESPYLERLNAIYHDDYVVLGQDSGLIEW